MKFCSPDHVGDSIDDNVKPGRHGPGAIIVPIATCLSSETDRCFGARQAAYGFCSRSRVNYPRAISSQPLSMVSE